MSQKAWGGVFQEGTDARVEKFTESVSFDQRLYAHDIRGSLAHAEMLTEVGLLDEAELTQIRQGLAEIQQEIEAGEFEYNFALEDIHMHIERALIDKIGDVGRKLHTARSRNDQVSTDFRLWCRDAIDRVDARLVALQQAFVGRTDGDRDVILPAYTHLKRAQPVLAPHYWLCYCEKYERDRQRLADCRARLNELPLGAAALAGTTLPIDRHAVAEKLGFSTVMANSLDVSSDRDFALELAYVLTQISLHLSTWAEEWILWNTEEFGFLKLPEAFCTGSSIMPQKINPDVLELIRGKTARVVGNLMSLVTLAKGLPLAYNRDLQEDKPRLFDSVDTVEACLELAAPIVADSELDRQRISARLEAGHLDATTLMEHLIKRGIPQRTAHEVVGTLVRTALDRDAALAELPIETFQEACDELDETVYDSLGVANAVSAFVSYGSTAPAEVDKQIARWKEKLAQS